MVFFSRRFAVVMDNPEPVPLAVFEYLQSPKRIGGQEIYDRQAK
jgi:hypothetical protein